MSLKKMGALLVAASVTLTACGTKDDTKQASAPTVQPSVSAQAAQDPTKAEVSDAVDQVKAHKEIIEELSKGTSGGKTDYDKVLKIYNERFKKLVQTSDPEAGDQQLSSAIQAGKEGALPGDVVQQLVDKLGQNVFFLAMRSDFKELDTAFADKAKAKQKWEEAKTYYSVLKGTVEKRDSAYQTQMGSAIDSGFDGIAKAIDSGSKPDFSLGRQVVDKTLMKTFYLASGGAQGYAYKIEKAVQEGKPGKVEQAEGWAFYQALHAYIAGQDKEDAEFIQNNFDLKTNPKDIKADEINKAFVRGFANVAKDEYKQTFVNFDNDKGPVTALEGALFIQVVEADAMKLLGEPQTKTLLEKAGQLLEAAKAKDKAKAEALYKEIEPSLDKLAKTGK